MQVDQNEDIERRGAQGSDSGNSGWTPQPGSKLRDKLQNLAAWRIDPASIEFQEDAPEFRGGHARVSRAFLVSTSSSESSVDDSADTSGDKKSGGGISSRKAVAVKELNFESGTDKERVFGLALREAGFLTKLCHENVIKLEGFVEDLAEDRVWLIFPWAAGGNLKDFVAAGDWEIPERIWLIHDVARGVEYLHTQSPSIYHGDLKSVNVLVNLKHRAVITDFGSARHLTRTDPPVQPERSENGAQPTLLLETKLCEATNTMTLTGNQYTLRWAPPELLMDDEPGLWSDIWALGWVFYEVMTNSIPFQNILKDSVVVIHVIQGNLPSVADHASMVLIRELYSLMIMCWSIDPNRQRAANTSVSQNLSPELLIKMGQMHRIQNDYVNASKFLTEALDICTETADNAAKADALFGLAEVNRGQNNYNKAVQLYSEVVQIYTDVGNRRGRADALWGLAGVHRSQGEYSEATKFYSEVIQTCTEIGDTHGKADALRGLADVHRAQHEYSEAAKLYSEVVQVCTDIGDRHGKADALRGLAHVHRAQNEYGEAVPLYSEAIQISTDIGNRQGRTNALWGLAEVHRLQSQYSQAVQLFSESLQICIDIGDRSGAAWALMSLADVHYDQDQLEDAIRLYEQAAGIFEEIGPTQDAAEAINRAAEARQKLKPAEAQ